MVTLETPLVMGILNVTPDSFFDGGHYHDGPSLLNHVEKMLSDGAAIIDVGGYSSRPGADTISTEEEVKRSITAIKQIKIHFPDAVLSIDTFRATVAHAAINEGAHIVNDISGGELDQEMFKTVARLNVPYICMHMKGTPQTMTSLSTYDNLLQEIVSYFHKKTDHLKTLGVKDIIIDPGFGFAKTIAQNFQLLNELHFLNILEKPILVGLSRKSMIWKTLNTTPDKALTGTTMLNTLALAKGASILRVHDVKEAMETIKLFSNLSSAPVRV